MMRNFAARLVWRNLVVRLVWRNLAVRLVWELVGAEAVEPVPARIVYLEGSERQKRA